MIALHVPNEVTVSDLAAALLTIGLNLTSTPKGALVATWSKSRNPPACCAECGSLATVHDGGRLLCSRCFLDQARAGATHG